jgi:small subunit ribosomal protein S17
MAEEAGGAQAGAAQQTAPRQKVRVGVVVSDKMQKTVVVSVESVKHHRLYHKTLRRTKRYKAHDEHDQCRLGDRVRIIETRPLSKEKRWRVAEILTRGNVADVQPRAIGAEILEPGRAQPVRTPESQPPARASSTAEQEAQA